MKQILTLSATSWLFLSVQARASTLSRPTLLASVNPDEKTSITITDNTLNRLDSNFFNPELSLELSSKTRTQKVTLFSFTTSIIHVQTKPNLKSIIRYYSD